ncbi:MAG: hypothetical protein WC975_02910 [Phycisphaerae bacterium]
MKHGITERALLEPFDVFLGDHPQIHHPDPVRLSVAGFHHGHNRFDRGRAVAIAVKDFIPQLYPVAGHHQGNQNLLAVRPQRTLRTRRQ